MRNVLSALSLSATLLSTAASADPFRAVSLAGSQPLAIFALSQEGLPQEAADQARILEARMGYRQLPGTAAHREFRFRPVLAYDANVNGGMANDRLQVAGLTFLVNPDYVAKPGLLIGIEGSGTYRQNIGPGTALELRGRAQFAWSPQHEVSRTSVDLDACLRQQFSVSRFGHVCASASHRRVELGRQTMLDFHAGGTQAFVMGGGLHAVTAEVGVRRVMPNGGVEWTQGYGRLSLVSALRSGTALNASFEVGQRVDGVHASRYRVSMGAARIIAGRPTSLSLFASTSEGGLFLGQPRRDVNYGIGVTRQLNDRLTVGLSVTGTRSNASFHESGPTLGMTFNMTF